MVACRLGTGGGITKEDKPTLGGDGNLQRLECDDGFTGVCVKIHYIYITFIS